MSERNKRLPEGMILRGRTWWADFQIHGRRIRKSLCRNLDTAREMLLELRARAQKGDFGLLDNDYLLADLQAEWVRHCEQTKKPGTVQRYRYSLQAIGPCLPARVGQLTAQTILAYRERRLADGVCPRTVNMDVGTVVSMLRWAVKQGIVGSNPIAGIERLDHDHPKEGRPLTTEEVGRLLATSPEPWRDVWYAFLVTGLRKNELASLTFDDIDQEARELTVRRGVAKNHQARNVPIDDGLWDILVRLREAREDRRPGWGKSPKLTARIQERFTRDHVFTTSQCTPLIHGSGLYHVFIRHCRQAGIETRRLDAEGGEIDHVDLHSLRRTYATDAIEGGANPKSVQELLGHRTLDMTMRLYAKTRTQAKRQAVAALSYGKGCTGPAHVVEFPAGGVQECHKIPTIVKTAAGGLT